jgi:Ca2+-binding RTX toxin-like protein
MQTKYRWLKTSLTLLFALVFVVGMLPVRAVQAQDVGVSVEPLPPIGVSLTSFTADGFSTATLSWTGGPAGSIPVEIYQSVDMIWDAGDTLLGTVTVTDGTTGTEDFTIGSGAGEMPLPFDTDVTTDYYLLAKSGASTASFVGVYHKQVVTAAEGVDVVTTPVYLHGGEGVDTVTFSPGMTLNWDNAGTPVAYDYNGKGVSEFRFRLHGGNDSADANSVKPTVMWGGAGDDTLDASFSAVGTTLYGGEGSDVLKGSPFADFLYGEGGNDTLVGGVGNDTLDGGPGDDLLRGGKGDDTLTGGAGSDTVSFNGATTGVRCDLRGQPGAVCTGEGSDTLSEIENLIGGPYNDRLNGDNNDNYLNGYIGDDDLYGNGGNDLLEGGWGNDRLWGGEGNDTLQGSGGNDQLYGESGNDILGGSFGNDIMNCGSGTQDWANFDSPAAVTVDLRITGPQDTIGQGIDTISNCENLIGSPFGDTLTGTDGNNQMRGLAGDDTIFGLAGDDILDGGPGTNVLDGGSGTDMVTYERSPVAMTVDLAAGTGVGGGGADLRSDTLISLENVTGSPFDDTLLGDSGPNVIDGFGGNDAMDGRGGVDMVTFARYGEGVDASLELGTASGLGATAFSSTILNFENVIGTPYDDIIEGNNADNVLDGGAGVDELTFENTGPGLGGVTVNLQSQTAIGRGTDTVKNFENLTGSNYDDDLTGTIGPNIIYGLDGNDTLNGNSGDDQLYGGNGDDTLIGDKGNDSIDGGAGVDKVSYFTSTAGVTVDLLAGTASNDGWGFTDTITTCENIQGTAYDDRLVGDNGDNTIWGEGGNDVIVGLDGLDTLRGGPGDDTLSAYSEGLNSSDGWADVVDGGAGTDTATYWAGEDVLVSIP